jgi:hypothetical protein
MWILREKLFSGREKAKRDPLVVSRPLNATRRCLIAKIDSFRSVYFSVGNAATVVAVWEITKP